MPSKYKEIFRIIPTGLITFLLFLTFANFHFSQSGNDSTPKKLKEREIIFQAEKLLSEKGYWITKVDGVKDSSTYHAVAAFQKVEGRKRTGILNLQELEAIKKADRPFPIFIGAEHIEIDLKRQILFLVNEEDMVTHVLPVSTGNGKAYYERGKKQIAYTPEGIFRISRQIKGIRRAPLGILYHPNYFYKGVAIHGSNSVPFYPASHGCVRIPRFAAKEFSDLVKVGLTVIVHSVSEETRILFEQINKAEIFKRNQLKNIPCESKMIG